MGEINMKHEIVKEKLTVEILKKEAVLFANSQSNIRHENLIGVTDGKAIGTYFEQAFKTYLYGKYLVDQGSSAVGIDLPDRHILTDIKVTSYRQPQSSTPFRDAKQKIFGLGHNLLVFVYIKNDNDQCNFRIASTTFIDAPQTADYTTTKRLREMLKDGANKEDIIAYLMDRNIPGDDITLDRISDDILNNKVEQGYLTISNALQWRLQYSRVIRLDNQVEGVYNNVFEE